MRRRWIVAALAASVATPAIAAPPAPVSSDAAVMARVADQLDNPRTQRAIGDMMGAMAEAMLSMRIDGIRDAVQGAAGLPPRRDRTPETLGDVVGHDRAAIDTTKRQAAASAAMMGGMVRAMATALPAFQRAIEQAARAIPAPADPYSK